MLGTLNVIASFNEARISPRYMRWEHNHKTSPKQNRVNMAFRESWKKLCMLIGWLSIAFSSN
jgi:hypothetical protein